MANRKVLINRHTSTSGAPVASEMFYGEIDSIISVCPDKYFTPKLLAERKHVILPSAAQYSIDEQVELQLKQIKSILDSNNTNYIIRTCKSI